MPKAPPKLMALIEARRHLWRASTGADATCSQDPNELIAQLVDEYEKHLTPEQRAMVTAAL